MISKTTPINTWDAKPSRRNFTAADIIACKGNKKLTKTTANTIGEALAAFDSDIDMLIFDALNVELVREQARYNLNENDEPQYQ